MKILRLKFLLKKFEIKDSFKERMSEAGKSIDKLKASAKERLSSGKDKYDDFKDEVQLAYKHLRKALESL
jgi:predicted ribonuclease toxin of YeeF-YezG toxin-antitoxin module